VCPVYLLACAESRKRGRADKIAEHHGQLAAFMQLPAPPGRRFA
jgi:hypothetical protein